MKKSCIFCQIAKTKSPNKVYIIKNRYFVSIFEQFAVNPGHSTIIPRRHINSILDLDLQEWKILLPTTMEVVKIIEKTNFKELYELLLQKPISAASKWYCSRMLNHFALTKKPDGYNYGVNEDEAAGQTIKHLHLHVIPRYNGDIEDPTGGVRNVIPELGNYKKIYLK